MKRFYLLLLLLPCCNLGFSQGGSSLYAGYGYAGGVMNLSGLNEIVSEYNSTRSWLDQELKNFGYVAGFNANYGMALNGFWVDSEMSFRRKKQSASGTSPSAGDAIRELKLRNNNFAFTTGIMSPGQYARTGLGLRMDLGFQKMFTRVYPEGEKKTDWESPLGSQFLIGFGPNVKFIQFLGDDGLALIYSFHYTHSLIDTNWDRFGEAINPVTHVRSDTDFRSSNSFFGFSVVFGFASQE